MKVTLDCSGIWGQLFKISKLKKPKLNTKHTHYHHQQSNKIPFSVIAKNEALSQFLFHLGVYEPLE